MKCYKTVVMPGIVVHDCNSLYLGGREEQVFEIDHPAAGVTGGCELPDVSAENRIWIF